MKAVWRGKVLAESKKTVMFEGAIFFPLEAVNERYLQKTSIQSTDPVKGQALHYNLFVDGVVFQNAAVYYPGPTISARQIERHITFASSIELKS
jgi:uncharacterized protein (DUF427 family)